MKGVQQSQTFHGAGSVVAHLRLPLQLTLAPLYLWGVLGAGGRWSLATVTVFVALHIFLYGGTTVFNSYYDRDEGPIALMEHPLALPGWALPFSLVWQGIGAVAVTLISAPLGAFYIAYAVAGALYSHPRTRLKARPYTSTLLVFVFQGSGGFLAGWLASGQPADSLVTGRFWLMALAAAFATLGLYPLTQVYQIDEDAARGDRTLAVVLGPVRACLFAVAAFCVAAVCGLWALVAMGHPLGGVLFAGGYVPLSAATIVLGRQFARRPLLVNFHRFVALQFLGALFFALFITVQLAHPL